MRRRKRKTRKRREEQVKSTESDGKDSAPTLDVGRRRGEMRVEGRSGDIPADSIAAKPMARRCCCCVVALMMVERIEGSGVEGCTSESRWLRSRDQSQAKTRRQLDLVGAMAAW